MGMMDHLFVDSCTILRRHQKQKLSYVSGTAAFHLGAKLTGGTSGAIATIDKAPSGTVQTGYLVLRQVTGVFVNGETITDNGTPVGSATVSGAPSGYLNGSNEAEYSGFETDQTNVLCRFYSMQSRNLVMGPGENPDYQPMVQLPSTVTINQFDYQIVSGSSVFPGTYQIIGPVRPAKGVWGIDHYECKLKVVPGQ